MARKKTAAKKKVTRARVVMSAGPSELLPTPPPSEDAVTLSVDIPRKISFRLKVALLQMEAKGEKATKRQFVENALATALDAFDNEWGA